MTKYILCMYKKKKTIRRTEIWSITLYSIWYLFILAHVPMQDVDKIIGQLCFLQKRTVNTVLQHNGTQK